MNKSEIERRYNQLIKDVSEKEFYKIDLNNRVNCYTCQSCGKITKTKDIDAGVTPFMHSCAYCKSTAYSSFYRDIAPHLEPVEEWYRPTLKQCLEMKPDSGLLDHVLNGGLDVRKIDSSTNKN